MVHEDLSQSIQRETDHTIRVIDHQVRIQSCQKRAVEFPPTDTVGMEALGAEIVDHAGSPEFVHGWRTIVGGSGLGVKLGSLVDDLDWNAASSQHEAEKKAGGSCSYNDGPWY